MYKILLAIQDSDLVNTVSCILKDNNISFDKIGSKKTLEKNQKSKIYNSVIIDEDFDDKGFSAIDAVNSIRNINTDLPILAITNDVKLTKISELLETGVDAYIESPVNHIKILNAIKKLKSLAELRLDAKNYKEEFYKTTTLVGNSRSTTLLRETIQKIIKSDSSSLITGDIGTEKIEIAKLLHQSSKRSSNRAIVFKCNSHDEKNNGTSVFGHLLNSKLNFTGALEKANGGTLILCEFHLLPLETQEELLNYLNKKSSIGTLSEINVKIIATTSEKPLELVKKKRVNVSLITKLRINEINVPSLAQRKEDIEDMLEQIVDDCAKKYSLNKISFSESAIIALQAFDWPCNLVQLQNIVESAFLNAVQDNVKTIEPESISPEIFLNNPANINPSINHEIMSLDLRNARALFEKQFITAQIQRFGGNISHTATFIGMERTALHRKLSLLGISSDDVRAGIKGYERRSKVNQ